MNKTLAAIAGCGLALALLAAGCSSGSGGGAASSASSGTTGGSPGGSRAGGTAPALVWRSCDQVAPRLQCASLRVPLNYARPGGRKITLALTRLPATAPPSQRQGVLLVNPGGPGGPGRSMAANVGQGLDPAVAADYDIIGFDTRGTGRLGPGAALRPWLLRPAAARLHPGQQGGRAGTGQPGPRLRG